VLRRQSGGRSDCRQGAIAFRLWKVPSIVILLLLALTFAAAMRSGVDWLRRRRVREPLAILFFFLLVLGVVGMFFWLAVSAGTAST
jgi:predicted PurR-regulated permease PerM